MADDRWATPPPAPAAIEHPGVEGSALPGERDTDPAPSLAGDPDDELIPNRRYESL